MVKKQGDGALDQFLKRWGQWLLPLIGMLCYANSTQNGFVLDDAIVITENAFTVEGVDGWRGILSEDTFHGFFQKPDKDQLVSGGRYRPFSLMVFAVEYQLFGKNPSLFHLFNILFYGMLIWCMFQWLGALLREYPQAFWLAFFAVLLFAVHPLHTEVVANIKGRDEIFALLFSILAAWFSLKSVDQERNSILNLVLAGAFFFLGLMSKENTITYLAVIPLSIYFFRKNLRFSLISLAGPTIASLIFLLIRDSIIGSSLGTPPLELMNNPYLKWTGETYVHMSFAEKLPLIFESLARYIQLFLFPSPLTHDYYPYVIESNSFTSPWVLASLLIYASMIASIFYFWNRKPIVSWSLITFLAGLSIVSNLVFPVGTNMSERFMFMPSLGLCVLVSYGLCRMNTQKSTLGLACLGAVVLIFFSSTWLRNQDWKSNLTLFSADIKHSSQSAKLQNALGGVLLEDVQKLKEPKRSEQIKKAIGHLKKAKEIHPTYKGPELLLGNAYYYLGDFKNSEINYKKALQLDPDFADAQLNLAMCYRELGEYDRALTGMKNMTTNPKIEPSRLNQLRLTCEEAGRSYSDKGDIKQALKYFKAGLSAGGEKAKFNYFIAVAYAQQGNLEESLAYINEALKHPSEENNKKSIISLKTRIEADLKNR